MPLTRIRGRRAPRAFVVSPEPPLWSGLSKALRDRGFRIDVAARIPEPLAAASLGCYALVMVDTAALAPDLVGACRALRAAEGGARAALILLARQADTAGLEEAVQIAVDDVILAMPQGRWHSIRLAAIEKRLCLLSDQRVANDRLRRFEKAFETMQLGVTITDTAGTILYTNPADATMHGYTVEELLGAHASVFALPGRRRSLTPRDLQTVSRWHRETLNVRKNGEAFPVQLMSDVVRDDRERATGLVTTCEDISERNRAAEALRESEERYARAARGANDALWDWDPLQDCLYLSPRWNEMLGAGNAEVRGTSSAWFDRVHPDDISALQASLAAHRAGQLPHFSCEHRVRRHDGSYIWVLARGLEEMRTDGRPGRLAGSLTDITNHKLHDPLTRLPNRALMLDRLAHALERARRANAYRLALLALDLDRFAHVSESYGPAAADRLVETAAERLRACLHGIDSLAVGDTALAHMGGGRFTILLQEIEQARDAARIAMRLQECLGRPFSVERHEVFTTASIGIAVVSQTYEEANEVLRDVDAALAQARRAGGNRYVVFDSEMHARAVATLQLENDLRHALERDELRVVYQPIIALASGDLAGFEALVRWQRAEGPLLLPQDFVPLAEETGLVVPMDRWVLAQACRQTRSWLSHGRRRAPLTVAVNVSGLQFKQPDFTVEIDRTLRSVGLLGRALKLEITESVFMEQAQVASALLAELRSLDVRLSVDDFGTGYSSLAYLYRFEIDTLKVDRSFIARAQSDGDSREIVRAIVSLGQNLRKEVVAEGLETRSQLTLLRELGCQYGQGFLFAPPLNPDAASRLVERCDDRPAYEF
jgi:diguanylate cyclase (GGDEF)-like protein/PAS domain S-box-containing protein